MTEPPMFPVYGGSPTPYGMPMDEYMKFIVGLGQALGLERSHMSESKTLDEAIQAASNELCYSCNWSKDHAPRFAAIIKKHLSALIENDNAVVELQRVQNERLRYALTRIRAKITETATDCMCHTCAVFRLADDALSWKDGK